MPYTAPPAPAASSSLQIVIDIDSLLVDTAAGVRHALHSVARLRNRRGTIRLTQEQLRSRSLADLIGEIAGCDDAGMIAELVEHYWRVYEQESRFRAPLLPGAASLMRTLAAMNANLHYVSTYGPQAATALVHRRGLAQLLTTVYTPPQSICPCARSPLFENFICGRVAPAHRHLLLSDHLPELYTAQRIGVPALALGYGRTAGPCLESVPGLLGVADSPQDVGRWLRAHAAADGYLHDRSRRTAAQLH